MKRFAMTVMLKDSPGVIDKYEAYHADPWPEVNAGLLSCGILRMFIYRFGRQLFMFMETEDDFDMERDLPKYIEDPKAREWDEMMADFQDAVPGAPEGSKWVEMKEVYALGEK
jgi:L-rhamnose mutarotase